MGVVANSAYQEGLALKANSADVIASSNPIGLNDLVADAFSLSGVPVGGSGSPASQTVAGPVVFSGAVTFSAGLLGHVVVLSVAGPYTVAATDRYVLVNFAGAMIVNLPAAPVIGRLVTVKDISGLAATNVITVKGTQNIDGITGSTGVVVNTAYGSVDVVYNGTTWSIL
jgi:hypothetical protein